MLKRNEWYNEFTAKVDWIRLRKQVAWTEVYNTEEDIINDLMIIDYTENPGYLYKGYDYIHSFAKRLQGGKDLTPAQMKQAKRLAVEIRKAALLNR